MDNTNPILAYQEFPDYALIKPKHFVPAVEEAVKVGRELINQVITLTEERTFSNTIVPTLEAGKYIKKIFSPISQIFSLMSSDEVQTEYQKAVQILTEYSNEVSMNEDYYKAIKAYSKTNDYSNLSPEKKRYMDIVMRDFRLSGAELSEEDKTKLKELNFKLSDLSIKFNNNALKSTFDLVIEDETDLAGLSEDIKTQAKDLAISKDKPNAWIFNFDMPSYLPFMKYSEKSNLKETLWRKYMTKATEGELDNRPVISEILKYKKAKANLLGFETYAQFSLETKMAESPEVVENFLSDIALKLAEKGLEERNEVIELQKEVNGKENLTPWDSTYWTNKLKEKKYSYNEDQVREYLPISACMEGLFTIAKGLFGLTFEICPEIPVWHKDVTAYKVLDESGCIRSYMYFDLHPRSGLKRAGAWMSQIKKAETDDNGKIIIPAQVGVHCNFSTPVGDKPALLTFGEVETLFHEFGHALHGALGKTELAALSGTDVPWDVVELPSQFMEHFVRNAETLNLFAKHYKTGELMPADLMERVIDSTKFQKASFTRAQIVYGMFDMTLHHEESKGEQTPDAHEVHKKIHTKYSHVPYYDDTYFEAAFGHIFGGGYAAGYYSYMWANILDSDAFSKFSESGKVLNREVGKEFMENILEKGNSEDMNDLFTKFRGRPASPEPFLQSIGIED